MALPIIGSAHERTGLPDFTWFIYGSSLSREAFAAWAERHGYPLPDFDKAVAARLADFRLSFDVQSGFWGGAVASLAEAKGSSVEGIALPLPGTARTLVDHKEGALSGLYEPFPVKVTPLGKPSMAPIDAIAFRAAASRRLPSATTPSPTFVDTLRAGAREWKLSASYQAELGRL